MARDYRWRPNAKPLICDLRAYWGWPHRIRTDQTRLRLGIRVSTWSRSPHVGLVPPIVQKRPSGRSLPVTQTFFSFAVSPPSLPALPPENAPARLLPSWLKEALWQPRNKFSPIAPMHSSPPVLAPNQAKPSRA